MRSSTFVAAGMAATAHAITTVTVTEDTTVTYCAPSVTNCIVNGWDQWQGGNYPVPTPAQTTSTWAYWNSNNPQPTAGGHYGKPQPPAGWHEWNYEDGDVPEGWYEWQYTYEVVAAPPAGWYEWNYSNGPMPANWDDWKYIKPVSPPAGWYEWDYSKGSKPAEWDAWKVVVITKTCDEADAKHPKPTGWYEWNYNNGAKPATWDDWKVVVETTTWANWEQPKEQPKPTSAAQDEWAKWNAAASGTAACPKNDGAPSDWCYYSYSSKPAVETKTKPADAASTWAQWSNVDVKASQTGPNIAKWTGAASSNSVSFAMAGVAGLAAFLL